MNDARDLLARLHEKYSRCVAYQDKGTITRCRKFEDREVETVVTFQTEFKRAELFEFQWTDPEKGSFRVSERGGCATVESPRVGETQENSLKEALGVSAGISMGATSLVPRMLITEAFDRTRFNALSVQLIERSELNAVECHHIVGQSGADSIEIWINEELILRRVLTASDMSAEMQQNLIAEAQKLVQSFSPTLTGATYRLITDVRYSTVAISPALIGKIEP